VAFYRRFVNAPQIRQGNFNRFEMKSSRSRPLWDSHSSRLLLLNLIHGSVSVGRKKNLCALIFRVPRDRNSKLKETLDVCDKIYGGATALLQYVSSSYIGLLTSFEVAMVKMFHGLIHNMILITTSGNEPLVAWRSQGPSIAIMVCGTRAGAAVVDVLIHIKLLRRQDFVSVRPKKLFVSVQYLANPMCSYAGIGH